MELTPSFHIEQLLVNWCMLKMSPHKLVVAYWNRFRKRNMPFNATSLRLCIGMNGKCEEEKSSS